MDLNNKDSLESTDRPPLPPKNVVIRGPPLPPKISRSKFEIPVTTKVKQQNKTKQLSKEIVFNNQSYTLTDTGKNVFEKDEILPEKKEIYENYASKKIVRNESGQERKEISKNKKSKENVSKKFDTIIEKNKFETGLSKENKSSDTKYSLVPENKEIYKTDDPKENVPVEIDSTLEEEMFEKCIMNEIELSKRKSHSLLGKMINFFKSSKKSTKNKHSEILCEHCHLSCSNVTICTQSAHICSCCHSVFQCHHHYNYHHPIRFENRFPEWENRILEREDICQERDNRFNERENVNLSVTRASHHHVDHGHMSEFCLRCGGLSTSSSCNFVASPVVPNRSQVQSAESISVQPEPIFVSPSVDPKEPSPMEKYSINFLTSNLAQLKKVGWYWGSVSSAEAERVMSSQPDGTFLVRDSAHSEYLFSVTFRVNFCTYHARIQFCKNRFWWNHNNQDDGFKSIIDLITNSMEISRRGEYRYFENTENVSVPPYAVSLLYPLSRFTVVNSLKHLTRFIIISNVRSDHLESLQLPPYLKSYLYDKEHYYIENLDRYMEIINKEPHSVE